MHPAATAGPAARFVYGGYAWLALLAAVFPLAAVLAVLPGLERRRRAARWAAKAFFRMIGSPVRVEGRVPDEHCVVVANHASYLDGIILTAALPPRFTFLIKHEMAFVPLAGFVLRRLGSKFVDRTDPRHRKHTVRELVSSAIQGDSLALFPEGTFAAESGLRPFQAGAFGAAWRAQRRVVPVVVIGARTKLPSGARLPAPGPLLVKICAPLDARAFGSARDLMLTARAAILEHLGEPDLCSRDRTESPDAVAPAAALLADGHIAE